MSMLSQEALLVRDALSVRGLENPLIELNINHQIRKRRIENHMRAVVHLLNLDLEHDSLSNTPKRIAKMYIEEIFSGLDYSNFPKIAIIPNTMQINEMITVRGINITSTCEHHFIVFNGTVTISYIPENNMIGLSKINRIVQFFSKRPQLQERLTKQIFLALQTLLNTNNVAIFIDAVHYCVKARGINDVSSTTTTTVLGGVFESDTNIRKEFLHAIMYCKR
ncbi:GTP cyclohydrolase I FolE [Blochmannia endosymbiont of Camponotus sp. C-003]|uniref:GTP cyclohydrolase I FolE n=1 Tax=unclassified Candidatus Blochmanniella TaxID=711328 RepID=UPI002025AD79|nr:MULTISPECIES: GTP cyclohydrolase I FolE [unclassified Candidatus Blochmannia]URJ23358.1 GTP cyclohydrolase I FolE [Blochmannia endosymbiont of Camponotus sp. C-003]URJ28831.1 GTP cyclohydrolase I FolE [Blochmannia endosymbiont of Camponotus sp. C-046]